VNPGLYSVPTNFTGVVIRHSRRMGGMFEDNIPYKDGKKHGVLTRWRIRKEGDLIIKEYVAATITYKAGAVHGETLYSYPNGQLQRQEHYADDKQDGECRAYYPSGGFREYSMYKNGKRHGLEESYYENGNLRRTVVFYEGEYDQELREYFEDGQLEFVTGYNTGKKHGIFRRYSKQGILIGEAMHNNGLLEWSKQFRWDGKITEHALYAGGKRNGITTHYYPTGKVASKTYYVDDRQKSHIRYDTRGKVTEEKTY